MMLTIALVVMVIFLFLRTLAATIIPSIAVPLSIVGTFAVMYLLGYSLDNLSLMALTISTGFVVDDAIVMIENIERYIEEGHSPAGGGAAGLRPDRLHHRVVDGVADCGADSAAVHGRHCGTPVPRVRRDPERDHPAVGDYLADPDADDVLAAAAAPGSVEAQPSVRVVGTGLQQHDCLLRAHREVRARSSDRDVAGHYRHPGRNHLSVHRRPQRLLPGAGYRRDSSAFRTRRRVFRSRPCRNARKHWQRPS